MVKRISLSKFFVLFFLILVYLISGALIQDFDKYLGVERLVNLGMNTLLMLITVLCTFAVTEQKVWRKTVIILSVLILLIHLFLYPNNNSSLHLGLQFAFYSVNMIVLFVATGLTFWHLLYANDINKDHLLGSICGYFLLGFSWAFLYIILNLLQPGTFAGVVISSSIHQTVLSFFSYSFDISTTIGNSVIRPTTNLSRLLTCLEAISAQMYLVILISYLVGVHSGATTNRTKGIKRQ